MSTSRPTDRAHGGGSGRAGWLAATITPRSLALGGLAVLALGYLSTLYWVTTIVGGTTGLVAGVAIGIGLGILLRNTRQRTVASVAAVGAVLAGVVYYSSASPSLEAATIGRVLGDGLAMVTGVTVLRLAALDVWIAALVPIPIFLTTYFGLRGRYGLAVVASGWLVCFLAATGDATTVETLLGSVGAVAAIGFGELDRRGGSLHGVDVLVALIAVMAVLAVTVPVAPSGSAGAITSTGGNSGSSPVAGGQGAGQSGPTPLDEQLLSGNSITAGGPINLSPDVRFVVHSEERLRYRLDALDRYDGDGWTRTGRSRPSLEELPEPLGESRTVTQRFELQAPAVNVPAAAYPMAVSGVPSDVLEATTTGAIVVEGRLPTGTNLTVRSAVPTASQTELRTAGTDYPVAIERRYTRLGNDIVPQRVFDLTGDITAQSSNPYDTARAIETYLEETKEYSQNVSAPEGTMADGFLFEMEAGYCTYFASTMATMLRTQGVPARVAVGYAGGQYVGNDTWVVRGTDAHAWVEVYFPDVGWVTFDPTPTTAARNARVEAIESARTAGIDAVDVPESEGGELRFEPPTQSTDEDGSDGTADGETTDTPESQGNSTVGPSNPRPDTDLRIGYPDGPEGSSADYVEPNMTAYREPGAVDDAWGPDGRDLRGTGTRLLGGLSLAVLALLLTAGTVAGGRQAGLQRQLRRAGTVLWQRRRDPETDVRVAMERLDAVLAERFEPRRDGETRREYRRRLPEHLEAEVGPAFDQYEQVRYAGHVERETADELVALVDGIARRRVPVLRRFGTAASVDDR